MLWVWFMEKIQVWNAKLTIPASGYSVASDDCEILWIIFKIKRWWQTLLLLYLYVCVTKWAMPSCLHSLFLADSTGMLSFLCVCDADIIFGSQRWECVIGSVVIQSWLSSLLNSQCADQAGTVWSDPNSLDAQGAGAESISISNLITIRSVPD